MWLRQTLARAIRSLDSKSDEYASMVSDMQKWTKEVMQVLGEKTFTVTTSNIYYVMFLSVVIYQLLWQPTVYSKGHQDMGHARVKQRRFTKGNFCNSIYLVVCVLICFFPLTLLECADNSSLRRSRTALPDKDHYIWTVILCYGSVKWDFIDIELKIQRWLYSSRELASHINSTPAPEFISTVQEC